MKVRAFEMIMVLFYVQELKEFILGSIESTDKISGVDRLAAGNAQAKEGKKLDRARAVLVAEQVITQAESDELFKLLDYRNDIGHAVQKLTVDVGPYAHLGKMHPTRFETMPLYDYTAAKRAKLLSEKIQRGMRQGFIMRCGFGGLQFEAAEKAYLAEIKRLKKRINKAIEIENRSIAETIQIIEAIPKPAMEVANPGHPGNLRENGSLTTAGKRCAFELFDVGATPLAVAYTMRISRRSANLWFQRWTATRP